MTFMTTLIAQLGPASLFLQAFLLHPDYQHSRIARFIRPALIPIAIGALSLAAYDARVDSGASEPKFKKVSLGAGLMANILRTILWGTTRSTYIRLTKDGLKKHDEKASSVSLFQRFLFAGSLMISHRGEGWSFDSSVPMRPNSNRSVDSDVWFLMVTLRRFFFNYYLGLLSLTWLAGTGVDSTVGLTTFYTRLGFSRAVSGVLESSLKPWIYTLLAGVLVWVMIDMVGCLIRLGAVTLKYLGRRLPPFKASGLGEIDLGEYSFMLNHPYRATSLAEFWGRRWHSIMRPLFVGCGSNPVEFVLTSLGCRSTPVVRAGRIIGAFGISTLIHEFALWYATYLDLNFSTSVFFLSQGLGVCLESVFKRLSGGRRAEGLAGRLWTFGWLLYWGRSMISTWYKHGVINLTPINEIITQQTWSSLLNPLFITTLILSPHVGGR